MDERVISPTHTLRSRTPMESIAYGIVPALLIIAMLLIVVKDIKIRAELDLHCGRVLMMHRNENAFVQHASSVQLSHAHSDLHIPKILSSKGVERIYTYDGIIFYQLHKTMSDEAYEVFVYAPLEHADPITGLLKRHPRRITYHVQYLQTPHWYYWQYK